MSDLILYSTLGCHLCEQAQEIIAPILDARGLPWREVDIADDDTLIAAYGIRIPVVQHSASRAELGWPFGPAEFSAWLEALPLDLPR